jgi:hypothetical protein
MLRHKNSTPDKFSLSVVYKLTCPDCNKAYIGQTGRRFSIHYNENKKACHNNTHTSSFAQHFHEQAKSFGSGENVRQVIQHQKKGACLKTVEKYYIDSEYIVNNHLNDNHSIFPNIVFDTLLKTAVPEIRDILGFLTRNVQFDFQPRPNSCFSNHLYCHLPKLRVRLLSQAGTTQPVRLLLPLPTSRQEVTCKNRFQFSVKFPRI